MKNFLKSKYHHIPGTLSLHKVSTIPGKDMLINYRQISCGCNSCLSDKFANCKYSDEFSEYPEPSQMLQYNFKLSSSKFSVDEGDLNEEEECEWDNIYKETEAAQYIEQGDLAVIKTGDDYPYYLLQVTSPPYETVSEVKDDFNHTIPPYHRVIEGNYLEVHKETVNGTLYYIETSKKAIISTFCIVGNCPLPQLVPTKKSKKMIDMFLISDDLHQTLCELVLSE